MIDPGDAASQSPAFGDLDGDGHLDLLIAGHGAIEPGYQMVIDEPGDPTRLWLGDGRGGFLDATDHLDPLIGDGYTFIVGLTDLDGDRMTDLFVANDYPRYLPTLAARNDGRGFAPAPAGLGLEIVGAGMGLGIGDINVDGVDDFLMPIWDRIMVLRSSGSGAWVKVAPALGFDVPRPESDEPWVGWGGEWADLDNDGDLDGLVAFGHLDTIVEVALGGNETVNARDQRLAAYVRGDDELFVESAESLGLDRIGAWRGFAAADLNGDGWVDLAARDLNGPIALFLSRCGEAGWLKIRPEPVHEAVGVEIEVVASGADRPRNWTRTIRAGGTSLASSAPPEALIGLGEIEEVDDVIVRWPDGTTHHTGPLQARQVVTVSRD